MPNRIIKDSIHTSETCDAMTDFQFRLWINLITYVDDYGRGDARAAVIKGTCFPLRERLTNKDIDAGLTALAGLGCISLYMVDGKPYLYFPTWEKHQSVRNKKSRFPEPPDDLQADDFNCVQTPANVPVIQSNPNPYPNPNPNTIGARAREFVPPTVEEVAEYCRERKNGVDPQYFVDHYTSKGWFVGKSKMKDWKASVRTWEKNTKERGGKGGLSEPAAAGNSGGDRDAAWGIRATVGPDRV